MGEVARLFVATAKHGPMLEQAEVRAVGNRGLEGCAHGRPGSRRQVLLMDGETLRQLGLAPGIVRENVTTEGIRLADLAVGQRLRIGNEVLFEVTIPCEPCEQLEAIRTGLRNEMEGRRGIFCRVAQGGLIRRGGVIEVVGRESAAPEQETEMRKVGSA